MAKICCVKGCETIDDITYFQFPNSHTLRKKWLDSIVITGKWNVQSLVCSQHFTEKDYEWVRGKQRLKGKVVPTVFHQTQKPINEIVEKSQNGEKTAESDDETDTKKRSRTDKRKRKATDESVEDRREKKRGRRKNDSSSEEENVKFTRSTRSRKTNSKSNQRKPKYDYSDSDDDRLVDVKKKERRRKKKESKSDDESHSDADSENDKCNLKDLQNDFTRNDVPRNDVSRNDVSRNDVSQNDNSQNDINSLNENDSFDNPPTPEFECPIDVITELTETNEDMELNDSTEKTSIGESSTPTSKEPHKEDIEEILTNYFIQTNTEVASKITEDAKTNHAQNDKDNSRNDNAKNDNGNNDKAKNDKAKNDKAKDDSNKTQMDYNIVDVDFEPKSPSYIEVSVDKNSKDTCPGSPQDCLMLLENVQCEIDPCSLLQEPSYDSDIEELPERPSDPISLLTSSDEDDVILQEPHIDTVEVSDETSDDAPLTTLVKNKKKKKKSSIDKIMWGYSDYFCMECNFTTDNRGEYNRHKAMHEEDNSKIMHVCSMCNYTTASKPQIIRHRKKHKEEKKYKCHACDYKAKHYMSLVYHLKSHQPGQGRKDDEDSDFGERLLCNKCDFRTKYPSRMIRHRKWCKPPKVRLVEKCPQCEYSTHRSFDMKRHFARMHRPQSPISEKTED